MLQVFGDILRDRLRLLRNDSQGWWRRFRRPRSFTPRGSLCVTYSLFGKFVFISTVFYSVSLRFNRICFMFCLQLAWILVYSLAHFWKTLINILFTQQQMLLLHYLGTLERISVFLFLFCKLSEDKATRDKNVIVTILRIFCMLQKLSSILFTIHNWVETIPKKSFFFCQNYVNLERRSLLGRETRYILP